MTRPIGLPLVWTSTMLVAVATALAAQSTPAPMFEVASVKASASTDERLTGGFLPGGRYQVRNYPLRSLIAAAYMRPQINPDFLIAGGPAWIDTARFDIDARAAGEFPAGPDGPAAPRRVMLQQLLAERFGLRTHVEARDAAIFTLVRSRADRLGPGLRPAKPDCDPCGISIAPGALTMKRVRLAQLVNLLPRFVNRLVVDRTMLDGAMDLELAWTPAPGEWVAPPSPTAPAPPADGPSLVSALDEQLGLRLVSGRGPVDYLVIDSVHVPTEN